MPNNVLFSKNDNLKVRFKSLRPDAVCSRGVLGD